MTPGEYFAKPLAIPHKQYEALRAFFVDKRKAEEVAQQFGYRVSAFYSLVRDFKTALNTPASDDFFFKTAKKGRSITSKTPARVALIVALRKKNFSVPDIKTMLDAHGQNVSEGSIVRILKQEGFARLPRRDQQTKHRPEVPSIDAPKSRPVTLQPEQFSSNVPGILCFLPYLGKYDLLTTIEQSLYPETGTITRTASGFFGSEAVQCQTVQC